MAYRFGSGVEPLAKTGAPVKQTIQMLRAGEKSGKLGKVCGKVSLFYEKKLEAPIKSVMALIEPLMSTVLGGIIATIAIALLPPVFKISSVIAHQPPKTTRACAGWRRPRNGANLFGRP